MGTLGHKRNSDEFYLVASGKTSQKSKRLGGKVWKADGNDPGKEGEGHPRNNPECMSGSSEGDKGLSGEGQLDTVMENKASSYCG